VACAALPLLAYPTHLSAVTRDLLITGYLTLLMALGVWEAFQRAAREPELKLTWRILGLVFLLAGLSFARQSVSNFAGVGLPSRLPTLQLLLWVVIATMLLLVPMGFNRAQHRSRHPWISLLDGAVFTLAMSELLWMWELNAIIQRAGLPSINRVGVLLLFGIVAAALGTTIHVAAKFGSLQGPTGACAAALMWIMAVLPWWVKVNFLQELRPAHPFRILLMVAFLLLWLAVRLPWPTRFARRKFRPWFLNLLPYLPAGVAFSGAIMHDLLYPNAHDRVETVLLGCLALLIFIRQVVAFREIWALQQNLEAKVEVRTQELAASARLLQRTQRMNLIATLGAGVAHDLNNLIGAALINLDLAAQTAGGSVSPSQEAMQTSLTKASQLARRMMTFGAEEPTTPGTIELSTYLTELQPTLRALIPLPTHLEIAHGAEILLVPGTSGLMDQVVVNLVVNARDATSSGGNISVKAERLPQDSAPGDWVCLSVADTGTGIPEKHLSHIFEPFFSTKAPGKGTGLGLGSVKAVVEKLGGTIQVQSVVGAGSCFSVHLPRINPS
jgi:signal transduction histidine kinase